MKYFKYILFSCLVASSLVAAEYQDGVEIDPIQSQIDTINVEISNLSNSASILTEDNTYTGSYNDFSAGDVRIALEPAQSNSAASQQYVLNLTGQFRTWFFRLSSTSDIAGCYAMTETGSEGVTTNITVGSITQDMYVARFSTPLNEPGTTEIQRGLRDIVCHMSKSSSRDLTIKSEYYITDALGNVLFEVDDSRSNQINQANSHEEWQVNVTTNIPSNITWREQIKFKVTSVGTPAPDLTIYTEGANEGYYAGAGGVPGQTGSGNTFTNGVTGWFDGRLLNSNGVFITKDGSNLWWTW